MEKELLERLARITEEEEKFLSGSDVVEKERYTDFRDFTVDSQKMLERGRLMDIRPHTRFVHFPDHKHNYIEIIYMCSGSTVHRINQRDTVKLRQGNLLFLNRNTSHEIMPAQKDDIAVNFIVLPEFFDVALNMVPQENVLRDFIISALCQDNSRLPYLHFQVADVLPIQNLVENMVWGAVHECPNRRKINQTTMGLLFLQLLNYTNSIQQPSLYKKEQIPVMAALKEIEENYRTAHLGDLSRIYHLSLSQYSRLITESTGNTFKELLRKKRLSKSAELLQNTKLSAADIMDAVGYDNSSYFYRMFREMYGCSPAQYRKHSLNASLSEEALNDDSNK